ncbi:MAG: hypothetical protein DMG97_37380 [Acidobacteria bacterium]|nr:MAG: hypothetical protein DMG97_37380 [Acidobacteriota bacterium]PYV66884.1 MAG: hypothetical protein DMG96_41080 [Acidobacteriota bacterium]
MKTDHSVLVLVVTLFLLSSCIAQTGHMGEDNAKLSLAQFRTIASACAPEIPIVTLRAIVRAESAFHPYALSLDYPQRTAKEQGFSGGQIFLARQPRALREARGWARWLNHNGKSVSIGLMQVSTKHLADLGLTADQLFDPCTNVHAGAEIFQTKYQHAAAHSGPGQEALREALSEYNSGSSVVGFDNGYVANVVDGEFYPRQLP